MKLLKASLLIACILMVFTVQSQDYVSVIKKIYQDMATMQKPQGEERFYFYLQVTALGEDNEKIAEEIKIYQSKDQIHTFNKGLEMYVDKSTFISVDHQEKVIYLTKNTQSTLSAAQQIVGNYTTAFWDKAKLLSSNDNNGVVELTFSVPKLDPSTELVERLQVNINKDQTRLLSVALFFKPGNKLKSQQVDYVSMDYNYKGNYQMTQSLISRFRTPSGELKEKYKNYQWIDARSTN